MRRYRRRACPAALEQDSGVTVAAGISKGGHCDKMTWWWNDSVRGRLRVKAAQDITKCRCVKDLHGNLEVLAKAKKYSNFPKPHEEIWNELTKQLWTHMRNGLAKFDDQLLCATCFYAVLALTETQDYLNEILTHINNCLVLRENDTKNTSESTFVISLMYGMFQSSFVTYKRTSNIEILGYVLKSTFNLLLSMAYEYSRHTYIVFKTLYSTKKALGTDLEEYIYSEENNLKLLNMVNHNWENPITGVRDMNRAIFQMLIHIVDDDMYQLVVDEICSFYWNKAKYLMLSEIVMKYNGNIKTILVTNDWTDGLIYSLHKPGLVSAGADMYFTILNKLFSEDDWCKMFLCHIIKIFTNSMTKAIENFTNYWCLATLKKFPKLLTVIVDKLKDHQDTEQILYGCLHLLKQGNKLGLVAKLWNSTEFKTTENLILNGIQHCNPHMRMLAFEIICITNTKSFPTQFEYQLILNYLHYNINSDSSVLRLSMLSSLNSFLTSLHSIIMNNVENKQNNDINYLFSFFNNIQQLVMNSLNFNGNYQRKFTSIKLCHVVLSCLSELPRKKQKQNGKLHRTAVQWLKDEGHWILHEESFILKLLGLLRDPADDVRENVVQLLLNHYSPDLRAPMLWHILVEDAETAMRSKFFYQISCSQSMFKLITNILIKEPSIDTKFKNVEDIFYFGYNECISEYNLKTDIVKSIQNGKQLHSLLSVLHVVLNVCIDKSYTIDIPPTNMIQLIDTLDGISNQFSWEQQTLTSSDFSKMSDMVQSMIASSGYDPHDVKDHTKISGLHQIVLNCLWLNVKASCDLASLLIRFNQEDSQTCEKCLKIIIHVLETSRHKGAIEAAGAALGRAIQYLTTLPEQYEVAQLPHSLLKCKLKELISDASTMSSVTRRGAGLSIMVHRIVSSDMKKGKPLFHYFMETLLETCDSIEDMPSTLNEAPDIDNQRDLPKAIYVHFLTRIVIDSSLASDMMHYSAKLAELAFYNLTSAHWQIRNAALQLYGALIPKLIGQKKASGSEDETVSTVACDEFRTHSPNLWKHIEHSLQSLNQPDLVLAHSNLVPILNVLANSAKRYNFSFDTVTRKDADDRLLRSLVLLLGSPLYIVRRLSAKCIYNIYSFDTIYNVVLKQEYQSENFIHGSLVLLTNYKTDLFKHQLHLEALERKFYAIMDKGKHSYLCRQLFEDLFHKENLQFKDMENTLLEVKNNLHKPGVSLWANKRFEKYINKTQWIEVPEILEYVLEQADYECYCKIILQKMKTDCNIPKEILVQMAHILLAFKNKFHSGIIWKIIYEISLKIDPTEFTDISEVIVYLETKSVSYKLRYILPFVARISSNIDANNLLQISRVIHTLSDPETMDVDMRHIAVLANNELANSFDRLSDAVKINCIKSAVTLLQDEDEDIRCLSSSFYSNIKGNKIMNPYIVLHKILSFEFLNSVLLDPVCSIENLCLDLCFVLSNTKCKASDEYNPFSNDSKNIYMEVDVLKELIEKLKIEL
ncbi:tRNA (32-2'-O)-methyltransferase regulator THADA-like [Aphomia sociella]